MRGTIVDIKEGAGSYGRDIQVVIFNDGTEEAYTVGTFFAAEGGRIGDIVVRINIGWQTAIEVDVAATYGPLSAKEW